ncbi:diacylglycerol kinase family protein [Amycolatopsis sp. NPDC051128]|uniref:diacylglycerol/lipid kinase family protein n=1 Tax=Amycolatopsis sp. NPDC051128 TaxID=3155412 RepID=UPI00341745B3
MRAILVVNPQATSTTAGGRDVLAHALASQVKLDVVETDYRGHARAIARSAARDGIDLVVAHGGDGTVNEVVNGLLADAAVTSGTSRTHGDPTEIGPVPALGVVPGGSANVFARALGISADPVEATHQLLNALENDRSRRVGLGLADGHWFTFNAGLGWDADVVGRVAKRRGKQTTAGLYLRAAVRSYFRPPLGRPALTIRIPGEEPAEAVTAFVSNTDPWSYLGERAIHLNPGCSFETGLGLFALSGLTLPTVFKHVRHALATKSNQRGRRLVRHDDLPMIRIDAAEPVNFQVDGDLVGQRTRVEFFSVPDALRVIT